MRRWDAPRSPTTKYPGFSIARTSPSRHDPHAPAIPATVPQSGGHPADPNGAHALPRPLAKAWPALVALSLCVSPAARAQVAPPIAIRATPATTPPVIDGRLDDEVWLGAEVIDDFTQVNPVNGAPPTERTEVRVLFDADHLYLGVRCFDTDPSAIVARSMARDAGHGSDDRVVITLDTFADRRNGYIFVVSAAGGKRDGIIEGTRTRYEWDGLWDARARVDDEGWTAEIAIPTKTLSFDPDITAWGFNFERYIKRKAEQLRWTSPSRNTSVARMSDAGQLTDLEGLAQGYGLTIKPFFTGKLDIDSEDLKFEPGVDIFYRITPSTTAALTINTDFAEAEVDTRTVNLTRFPLFFTEKRDFFLEDSGIFEFGGINQSPRPFFSRRIGIVGGQQKDILAGLRVTGRTGNLRFGLLDVQMKDDDELGQKNLGVLRLKHDVGEESSVGLILTNGKPGARGENQLAGIDFNFVDSDAWGGTATANAWAMATHDNPEEGPSENDDPFAIGGRASWAAAPWSFSAFADHVGKDFNPGLGFVQRPGTREFAASGSYTWRPETHDWIRTVSVLTSASGYANLNDQADTAALSLPRVTLTTHSADSAFILGILDRERLDSPYEIVDGVTIPTGEYDNAGWRAGFTTSDLRPVALQANYTQKGFYDGSREDTYVALTVTPNASFTFTGSYYLNEIELDSGDFTVRTVLAKATLQLSPELSWSNTLQWDNRSDQAALNSRVRYEFRPGQELFVVYNEGFDVIDNKFNSTSRELTVKAGLTFRF